MGYILSNITHFCVVSNTSYSYSTLFMFFLSSQRGKNRRDWDDGNVEMINAEGVQLLKVLRRFWEDLHIVVLYIYVHIISTHTRALVYTIWFRHLQIFQILRAGHQWFSLPRTLWADQNSSVQHVYFDALFWGKKTYENMKLNVCWMPCVQNPQ